MPNPLGGKLPLNYNFVCCEVVPQHIVRIDMSYYDKRFKRKRDPRHGKEFLRILE